MITNILDKTIAQASEEDWVIKYVALSPDCMKLLIEELRSLTNIDFDAAYVNKYREIDLHVKEITGFQVAYEHPPDY
jgi:hypothetical protein